MLLSKFGFRHRRLSSLKIGASFIFNNDVFYRGKALRGCGKVCVYSKPSLSPASLLFMRSDTFVWAID